MGLVPRRCSKLLLAGTLLTAGVVVYLSVWPLAEPQCHCGPPAPPPRQIVYRWLQGYNESSHLILPNVSVLQTMTWPQLAHLYHSYVENIQVLCGHMVRLGNLKDGGWETCDDVTYRPTHPCLIYSFGIKNDFSFDDAAAKYYSCHVHSFDPSTNMHDHQRSVNVTFHATGVADYDGYWTSWRMRKLKTIVDELGHQMVSEICGHFARAFRHLMN